MYNKENKHPLFSLKQTLWAVVTYNQPNIHRICVDNINNDNANCDAIKWISHTNLSAISGNGETKTGGSYSVIHYPKPMMFLKLKSSEQLQQSHLKCSFKIDIPWEKIFSNYISNKELLSKIYKKLI